MEIKTIEEAICEAHKVEFLTTRRERLHYAQVLLEAAEWGRKKDKENKEYCKSLRFAERYNSEN